MKEMKRGLLSCELRSEFIRLSGSEFIRFSLRPPAKPEQAGALGLLGGTFDPILIHVLVPLVLVGALLDRLARGRHAKLQAEGKADQAEGKVQNAVGGACAEQLLQLLGAGGYGDARLVRRGLGRARTRLPVAANASFRDPDQRVEPLARRQIEVRLRQAGGHAERHYVAQWIRAERPRRAAQPLIGHA